MCVQVNSVIILFSHHHKNTEKVAQVIAKVIGAEIKTPAQTDPSSVANFDLVGFGSGNYYGKFSKELLELVDKIPRATGKKAFIFATSGGGGKGAAKFHRPVKEKLQSKGFTVVGEFHCPGFDTWGPFKIVGGANKGRPNADDLKQAETFAQSLQKNEPSVLYIE